jgi:type I restriction enzyme, S subunit
MNNLKPYTKYKPSNIAWLGDIPEHWEVESFKNILTERNEKNNPIISKEILSLSIDKGVTLYAEKTTNLDRFKDDYTQYKLAHKNDLVFNSMNMIVGAVGVSPYFGCVSPVYYTYHSSQNYTKFYEYLFRCKTIQSVLYSLGRGLMAIDRGDGKYNTLRLKVARNDLRSMKLPFLSLAEQTAIANFLDYKLSKIARFIRKKKQLIKLLNEQKSGIINDAVTKGLNPNAKMKPSNIEWLGDIPEHWEVRKLKYVANFQSGEMITSETISSEGGEYPVYGGGGFRGYTNNYTNDGSHILIGRQGALCGNIKYANGKFWASEHSIVTYPKIKVENIYLGEILTICNLGKLSQTAAQPGIAIGQIKNVSVPIPPFEEQIYIVQHIEQETAQINAVIQTIEKEIALVQEYCTALIAEAVTGKIDVRDYEIPETPIVELYEEMEEEMSLAAEEEIEYLTEN